MSFSRRVAAVAATLAALVVTVSVTACSPASPATSATSPPPTSSSSASSGNAGAGGTASGNTVGGGGIIPVASTLHWSSCGGSLPGLQCSTLQVPLNYADPGGRKITLALSMAPATAPTSQQQGVLLVNPGGPGAPGRSLAGAVAAGLNPQVAAEYDVVGFDPRGVGASVPALSCDPNFFSGDRPDYIPANQAAEQVLIGRAKTYAADCEQRFGWLLPYMTTADIARDMDSIRQAFGVSKVNYYAFSYGTYLGQVYATMFPERIRRMVLDSTVDPAGVWYQDNIDQDYAFQRAEDDFYAWVAQNDATYHLGTTEAAVQAAWYEARARLKAHPIAGPNGPLDRPR